MTTEQMLRVQAGRIAILEARLKTLERQRSTPQAPSITVVRGDAWVGVYLDGDLVHQGKELRGEEMLELLGTDYDAVSADDRWLEERGQLPPRLGQVRREA